MFASRSEAANLRVVLVSTHRAILIVEGWPPMCNVPFCSISGDLPKEPTSSLVAASTAAGIPMRLPSSRLPTIESKGADGGSSRVGQWVFPALEKVD